MNIAFETHALAGAQLTLPDPSSWSRGRHDEGVSDKSASGGMTLAPFTYGDSRYLRLGWNEMHDDDVQTLRQLAASPDVHSLSDLSGTHAFVIFGAPEVDPIPGLPGYASVNVTVEFVWDAGVDTAIAQLPKPPPLQRRGAFAPRWSETGGKLSLFYPTEISPRHGQTDVNPKADVQVKFSLPIVEESFDPTLIRVLDSKGQAAGGGWTVTGDTLTFRTPYGLLPGETYTVELQSGKAGLRGVGGWWLAKPLTSTFSTDARGQVVTDSLSFSGFTAVADGLVRNTVPIYVMTPGGEPPIPSDQPDTDDGAPRVWAEIFFDDELITGADAVQVSFLDEFTNYEAPTRVYTRRLDGNSIIIETSAGNFGRLKFRVKAGTVGPIGKRRGRMQLDRVFEYNMSQATTSHLRSNYPGVKAVFGRIHKTKPFTAQDGYFFPEGTAPWTRETKHLWTPVTIDLSGPTAYPEEATEIGQTSTVPEHIRKLTQPPFQTASITENWEKWAYAARDNSAAPPLTPVTTNGVLDVVSATALTAGKLSVTFNVPLLDAQIPADAVQLAGDAGTLAAIGQIRDGLLEISAGSYAQGAYTLIVNTGGFLRGERGFAPKPSGRYEISVTATDGTPQLDEPGVLDLLSISPDLAAPIVPDSSVALTFDLPATIPAGALTVTRLLPTGQEEALSPTVTFSADQKTAYVSGVFTHDASTYVLTVKGGPDGAQGAGGELLEQTLIRRVLRTGYRLATQPPPRSRPAALTGERVVAAWDFQRGPVFNPAPGPWAFTGQGPLVPGTSENNAYALSLDKPLTGGMDLGMFEDYDAGFTAAMLVKLSAGGLIKVDLGNLQLTARETGGMLLVSGVANFLRAGTWRLIGAETDLGATGTLDQWMVVAFQYSPALNVVTLSIDGQVDSLSDPGIPGSDRQLQATVTGHSALISELLVLDSLTPMQTLEDYFGTL